MGIITQFFFLVFARPRSSTAAVFSIIGGAKIEILQARLTDGRACDMLQDLDLFSSSSVHNE